MKAILNLEALEASEEIESANLKKAHSQRLPEILKAKGVAKVTRYGKIQYYVVSPATIEGLVKQSRSPSDALDKLKARYRKAQTAMQTSAHKKAFRALAKASSGDLNASVKVGSHE
ncbi:MAG TPA: hypothetical protein VJ952_08340 [Opitutales bacterium]|nr:hypothetical protein [Opitutales bacterium]